MHLLTIFQHAFPFPCGQGKVLKVSDITMVCVTWCTRPAHHPYVGPPPTQWAEAPGDGHGDGTLIHLCWFFLL